VEDIVTNTKPVEEITRNGGKLPYKTTNRVRRYMQDYKKESKRGHREIHATHHTRNDHGIREPGKVRKYRK